MLPAGGPRCLVVEVMIELLILSFETRGENHSVTVQIDDVLLETQLGGVFEFFPASSIDGNADPNQTDQSVVASLDARLVAFDMIAARPGRKERSFAATAALLMGAHVPLFESYKVRLVMINDGSL